MIDEVMENSSSLINLFQRSFFKHLLSKPNKKGWSTQADHPFLFYGCYCYLCSLNFPLRMHLDLSRHNADCFSLFFCISSFVKGRITLAGDQKPRQLGGITFPSVTNDPAPSILFSPITA